VLLRAKIRTDSVYIYRCSVMNLCFLSSSQTAASRISTLDDRLCAFCTARLRLHYNFLPILFTTSTQVLQATMLLEIASVCLYEVIKISVIMKLVQLKHGATSTQQTIVFDLPAETTTAPMTVQVIGNTNTVESLVAS
jgi:hypothetical protein